MAKENAKALRLPIKVVLPPTERRPLGFTIVLAPNLAEAAIKAGTPGLEPELEQLIETGQPFQEDVLTPPAVPEGLPDGAVIKTELEDMPPSC